MRGRGGLAVWKNWEPREDLTSLGVTLSRDFQGELGSRQGAGEGRTAGGTVRGDGGPEGPEVTAGLPSLRWGKWQVMPRKLRDPPETPCEWELNTGRTSGAGR